MLKGYYRYREIERFCKNNQDSLGRYFGLRTMPSNVTIRHFISSLDFGLLQEAFHQWSKDYVCVAVGDSLSIDGKSIGSTVSDYSNSYQNFVSMVSVFSQKREQVLYAQKMENKKAYEGHVVEELLGILDLKGVVFTMDALHCKKNAGKNRK